MRLVLMHSMVHASSKVTKIMKMRSDFEKLLLHFMHLGRGEAGRFCLPESFQNKINRDWMVCS